eukprot:g6240.t1
MHMNMDRLPSDRLSSTRLPSDRRRSHSAGDKSEASPKVGLWMNMLRDEARWLGASGGRQTLTGRHDIDSVDQTRADAEVKPREPPQLVGVADCRLPLACLVRALKKRRTNHFARALVWYALYLFLLVELCDRYQNVHGSWEMEAAMNEAFVDEEFAGAQYKKNFQDIYSHAEWWEWAHGPLVSGVFMGKHFLPAGPNSSALLVSRENMLLGVQLRQLRARPSDTCAASGAAAAAAAAGGSGAAAGGGTQQLPWRHVTKNTCFGEYQRDQQERRAFGPPDAPARYAHSSALRGGRGVRWSWLRGEEGYGPGGHGRTIYGDEGYAVDLPLHNATEVRALLRQLERDNWLDRSTRSMLVSLSLYNPTLRIALAVRLQVEWFASGNVVPRMRTYPMRVQLLDDPILQLLTWLLMPCFFFFIFTDAFRMFYAYRCNRLWQHLATLWSVLELIHSCVVIFLFYLFIRWRTMRNAADFDIDDVLGQLRECRAKAAPEQSCFLDFADPADVTWDMNSTLAVLVLVSFLKCFKYFRLSRRLMLLWNTLRNAFDEIVSLGFVFAVLLIAFSTTGHFLFGARVHAFHNISTGISYLLLTVLGTFDYQQLREASPVYAPLFVALWIFVVFFVLVNMFIAVISDNRVSAAYRDVSEDARPSMINGVNTELLEMFSCCCGRWCTGAIMRTKNRMARSRHGTQSVFPMLESIGQFLTENAKQRMDAKNRAHQRVLSSRGPTHSAMNMQGVLDATLPLRQAPTPISPTQLEDTLKEIDMPVDSPAQPVRPETADDGLFESARGGGGGGDVLEHRERRGSRPFDTRGTMDIDASPRTRALTRAQRRNSSWIVSVIRAFGEGLSEEQDYLQKMEEKRALNNKIDAVMARANHRLIVEGTGTSVASHRTVTRAWQ